MLTNNYYSFTSASDYVFWRAYLNDSCIINEINMTFNETIYVDNVNISPAGFHSNNDIICQYTFFNSTGGSGNNQSNVSWFVNSVNVLNNSNSLSNSYFTLYDIVHGRTLFCCFSKICMQELVCP